MLIGEASVAILLEKTTESVQMTSLMRSDGEGYRYLIVPAGGYRNLNAKEKKRFVMMVIQDLCIIHLYRYICFYFYDNRCT